MYTLKSLLVIVLAVRAPVRSYCACFTLVFPPVSLCYPSVHSYFFFYFPLLLHSFFCNDSVKFSITTAFRFFSFPVHLLCYIHCRLLHLSSSVILLRILDYVHFPFFFFTHFYSCLTIDFLLSPILALLLLFLSLFCLVVFMCLHICVDGVNTVTHLSMGLSSASICEYFHALLLLYLFSLRSLSIRWLKTCIICVLSFVPVYCAFIV